MTDRKPKVASFDKVMTVEEVEKEKQSGSTLGKSLKHAEEEYQKRRKK